MKSIIYTLALTAVFSSAGLLLEAQPIPVELMMGNKYGTVNLSFSRNFSKESRFGFFHMNTVQFDYKDEAGNSFILQDLAYVENC